MLLVISRRTILGSIRVEAGVELMPLTTDTVGTDAGLLLQANGRVWLLLLLHEKGRDVGSMHGRDRGSTVHAHHADQLHDIVYRFNF